VLNLDLPKGVELAERRKTIDLIRSLNEANLPGEDPEFAARISAYDTAFKMQTEAPEVFDISKEPKETLDLYGVGDPKTDDYGRRCLLARRMVERVCVTSAWFLAAEPPIPNGTRTAISNPITSRWPP